MLEFDLSPEEADVFLQEAEEMLLQLNEGLVELERVGDRPDVVQQVFRAAHTLKGSGGVIGHHRMAEVLHSMETLLDRVRHGEMAVTPDLIDVLLQGTDVVRLLVGEVSTGEESGVDLAALMASLEAFVGGQPAPTARTDGGDDLIAAQEREALIQRAKAEGLRLIAVNVRIAKDSIAPGARALQTLLALQQSCQVAASRPQLDDLTDDWREFAVRAVALTDDTEAVSALLGSISEIEHAIEPLDGGGEVSAPKVAPAEPAAGAAVVQAPSTPAEAAAPAAAVASKATARESSQVKWVRTSVERLDKLMNLVSELVTDRNRLHQVRGNLVQTYGEDEGLSELAEALAHVSSITDQLQDEVMRARMVPVEHVFNKFPRVVRDLSRQLGKSIDLVIEGQDTELDRTVIEEISDPLMHLVRNCVDHGVEPPHVRRDLGKPERGTLRLAARSEESHIILEVEDDGAGIDAQKMRDAAVRKGLLEVEAAKALSDQEAIELIFQPGFSTAKVVSDVSGRGVGMDVVRTNIERLNGSVSVQTQLGQGTRFELKLPLTLAIFPALMVEVANNAYAVPLTVVVEALHVRNEDLKTIRGREAIVNRGAVLPILHLDDFFRCRNGNGKSSRYVVEIRWGATTVGLAVHRLLGRQEVVIKPLGHMIGEVPGISGGTIMGDGRVALILDTPSLVKAARKERLENGDR